MNAPIGIAPVVICFFLSGLASLVLEVVWTRHLRLVFGSTTLAASTILVAYMLGLGIGGLVGGRIAKRLRDGVRTYGWIEIVIAAYALAVPSLLSALPGLNRSLLQSLDFWPAAFARFGISLALLLLPTFLMGATLPVLVEALTRRDPRMGRVTALLYGVNTLGAVAGVFLATFVLFPTLGLLRSNLVGVGLDLFVGVIALTVLGRGSRARVTVDAGAAASAAAALSPDALPPRDAVARRAPAPEPRFLVLAVAAAVGFTALVYEVAWTRALATVLGSSIYGFSAMLGAFLLGIGLGSLIIRPWLDRMRRPVLILAAGVVLLGVLALGTTLAMPKLPQVYGMLMYAAMMSATSLTLLQVAICVAVMLPPTLVLGALFPLVARVAALRTAGAAEAVGQTYFANTVGSAAGAFCAGFLFIPVFGLARTLAAMVALDLVAGAITLLRMSRGSAAVRWASAPPLVAAALLLVVPIPFDILALTTGVFQDPDSKLEFGIPSVPVPGVPEEELVYYRDGVSATVSVHKLVGMYLTLRTNGKADASDHSDMGTQVLLGEVPLLFGPSPRKVMVIGFASGVTVGSVARHPEVERIDAVEIEPAMIEASRFFERRSGAPLDDPRVRVILDDARAYLSGTSERYDLIISQPSNPWVSGVSNLFTREFFQAARAALTPNGRLLQWVQLYGLEPEALHSIMAALGEQFPYVYGFAEKYGGPDLLLLAGQTPLRAEDLPDLERLPKSVRTDLARIGILSTEDLLSLVMLLPADVTGVARSALVNTDDNLHIELAGPWSIQSETMSSNWQAFREKRAGALALLAGTPLDQDALGRLALAYGRRGDIEIAAHLLTEAESRGHSGITIAAATVVARKLGGEQGLSVDNEIATLDKAVALSPGSIDARLLRAEALEQADRYKPMEHDAAAALKIDPSDQRARLLHARALALIGRDQDALAEAEVLLALPEGERLAKQEWSLLETTAKLQVALGQYDRAIETLEHHLHQNNTQWPEGWLMLARAYSEVGRPDSGLAAAETAMGVQKSIAARVNRQARAAIRRGFPDVAQTMLAQARDIDAENPTIAADLEALTRDEVPTAPSEPSESRAKTESTK